jgi:hypothetical protein
LVLKSNFIRHKKTPAVGNQPGFFAWLEDCSSSSNLKGLKDYVVNLSLGVFAPARKSVSRAYSKDKPRAQTSELSRCAGGCAICLLRIDIEVPSN